MTNLKYRTIKAFLEISKQRAYSQEDIKALANLEADLEMAYKENAGSEMTNVAKRLASTGENLLHTRKWAA